MNTKTYVEPLAVGFTDLHCHILPGLDDGASSQEKSSEMIAAAAATGITGLAATTHYSRGLEDLYPAMFKQISALAADKQLTLFKGCEYDYVFLTELSTDRLITLGNSKYFLVDMNQRFIPPAMMNVFFKFKLAGYKILFAHPERMLEGKEFDKLLNLLAENQIAIQINSGSITGRYGKQAMSNAFKILDRGLA
ncbi:MAG: CpsB/CapC family capsule biosynthesis tyrosine phosphatase, partial [Victivallaceae bacterium]